MDSAALKVPNKGTIETFSVVTGNKENYVIAFGITHNNEDKDNWDFEFANFKTVMPCVFNLRNDTLYSQDNDIIVQDATSHDAFFIADRDKGIAALANKVFPTHHIANCAKHIERNIEIQFGKQAAKDVIMISKTFSTRQEDYLFEHTKKVNKRAESYLWGIDPKLWRGTEYTRNENLPPRHGLVTSNAAECTNSWINDLRDKEPWLGILCGMTEKMCKFISDNRQKYRNKDPKEVVPRVQQIIYLRWEAAANMTVVEIEEATNEFTVSEVLNDKTKEDEQDTVGNSEIATAGIEKRRQYLLYPERKHCVCGRWQDTKFPCQHEMAYFRKWKEYTLFDVLRDEIHYYYRYGALQHLYTPNIVPVVTDALSFDGEALPPISKRSAGRPKKKRIRNCSKFVDHSMSPIICTICKEPGHNKRTCAKRNDKNENKRVAQLKNDADYD